MSKTSLSQYRTGVRWVVGQPTETNHVRVGSTGVSGQEYSLRGRLLLCSGLGLIIAEVTV